VAKLPEQERLAVHSFFIHEKDARRAAELLGLSRSGFYALLQRAVARLAKQLQPSEVSKKKV
jgi:RNA polymerase sigma-70 factor (ECF subfamily)